MANLCTAPEEPGDTRYVYGADCTWHDPIGQADGRRGGLPCCPHCGGELMELPKESDFWTVVRQMSSTRAGYEAIMRWSRGYCFPDFDTLENAFRQAMEGQS